MAVYHHIKQYINTCLVTMELLQTANCLYNDKNMNVLLNLRVKVIEKHMIVIFKLY